MNTATRRMMIGVTVTITEDAGFAGPGQAHRRPPPVTAVASAAPHPGARRGWLRSAVGALVATMLVGCATYRADPLPPAEAVIARKMPDLHRLKLAAAAFDHPLMGPVVLDLSNGLSPDEAAVLAVLANPDLVAARSTHGEAAAQLIAAGLLPNPVLSTEADQPHGSGSQGTVTAYNLGLELDVGSLVGRNARMAEAKAALQAVDLGIAWQEWQVAQAARLAAVRVASLDRRLAIVRAELAFERQTVKVLREAVQAGDLTIQDIGISRAAAENLQQVAGDLLRVRTETHSRLLLLLGLPPQAPLELEPIAAVGKKPSPLPAESELLRRATRYRLDTRALEIGYKAQEARVREAVLAQFPSLSIGLVAQRNEAALKFMGGFVNLGLPIFQRNKAAIALARATRTRLKHEYDARLSRIRSDVAQWTADDALLERQITSAERGIARLTDLEVAERQGVLNGDVSRLTWQEVRSTLLDMRLKLAALRQARLEGRVALGTAVGGVLPE